MKVYRLPLLLILTLCLAMSAFAQSETENPDASKKVVVIKKSIDENGQETVEKIVAEGAEADVLLQELLEEDVDVRDAAEIEEVKQHRFLNKSIVNEEEVEVEYTNDGDDVRVYKIRKGENDPVVIELKDDEGLTEEQKTLLEEHGFHVEDTGDGRVIWSSDGEVTIFNDPEGDDEGLGDRIHDMIGRIANLDFDFDFDFPEHLAFIGRNTNCIALGVYVDSGDNGELAIRSIIEGSGAEDAGLQAGDLIRGIDKKPVGNHLELLEALAEYEPGDVVTIDYEREGVLHAIQAELRAWKELPDFKDSYHAQIDCGDPGYQNLYNFLSPEVSRKIIIIKKGQDEAAGAELPENINQSPVTERGLNSSLALDNFVAYPNPTEGKFRIEFSAEAKPTVVSVFDAAGKEVFRDNLEDFPGQYNREVDLTGSAQGAFVLSVEQDGKVFTEQIVLH